MYFTLDWKWSQSDNLLALAWLVFWYNRGMERLYLIAAPDCKVIASEHRHALICTVSMLHDMLASAHVSIAMLVCIVCTWYDM